MIKKIFFILLITSSIGSLQAAPARNLFMKQPQHILVNNRILAKVNGNAISVIDVMKKMDLFFYRDFPQYANSVEARFEFYKVSWERVLQELIEKELIKADAKEVNLPISQGDIRQEMESLFGPNIIINLDKAGLSYDEATEMIKEDLLIRRMVMARVNAKVMRTVTPKLIRDYYVEWAIENAKPDEWTYHVISIRGKDSKANAKVANKAYDLLVSSNVPLEQLTENLPEDESVKCSVSKEFQHAPDQVSSAYKTILDKLEPQTYSQPIAQKSRASNSEVYRIFFLKEAIEGGAPSFPTVENKLKDILTSREMQKENLAYLTRLHDHFKVHMEDIKNDIPNDFQPFTIK